MSLKIRIKSKELPLLNKRKPRMKLIVRTSRETKCPLLKCKSTLQNESKPTDNLRSGVIFFLLLCFFGSRGKKITPDTFI